MNKYDAAWTSLKKHLQDITDLEGTLALLNWDQSVYMPSGGGLARARQIALLESLQHKHWTTPQLGEWLAIIENETKNQDPNSIQARQIENIRYTYDRSCRVPLSLREEQAKVTSECYLVWAKARPENNFKAVAPYLKKNLKMNLEVASYFPEHKNPLDVFISVFDRGLSVKTIKPLFDELKTELHQLMSDIAKKTQVDDSCIKRFYPKDLQWNFGIQVAKKIGYNFDNGRQDTTHHPFMTKIGQNDCRITTRIFENHFNAGFFGTVHEAGHALYEQNVSPELEDTTLATGTSFAVHESQSRLWENLVGRSFAFWEYFYPQLKKEFADTLKDISLEQFYKAINKVEPSLIRVEADEITYNLHIMIRFELEEALLSGNLTIDDLPEAWNKTYEKYLGIRPPNDSDGVMQDVHWYGISVGGYFQSYALGNILSAQFFDAALKAHPKLKEEFARGEFQNLLNWLKTNIHCHGKRFTTHEILKQSTGQELSVKPFVNYLREKYGKIYGLRQDIK